jgi:carbamoylphosphate synthase large subunit
VKTILITMVGAQTSPSVVEAIRHNQSEEVRIVGVDPTALIPGRFFVDSFYSITASFDDETKYISELLDICEKEKVDVVLPCGNEDCLAVTKNIQLFDNRNITVVSSSHAILVEAFDKLNVYTKIQKVSPQFAPKFYEIKNVDDFVLYAKRLGYPEKKLVLKPRHGRGGRGVYIIEPEVDFRAILQRKPEGIYSYNMVLEMIRENFEEFLLMEYLPGEIYSVYCLCNDGKSDIIIPHFRMWGNASNTLIGTVNLRSDIIEGVRKINQTFGFNYCINYELKIDDKGSPKIFDLNPRLAASVAIFRNIGINMPYLSIRQALGETVSVPEIKEGVVMMRYLKEINYNKEKGDAFEL